MISLNFAILIYLYSE